MKLKYTNNLSELKRLAKDIESFGNQENLSIDVIYALNLCLDEIITNIIMHGINAEPSESSVELDLEKCNGMVTACIKDQGLAFNPLTDMPRPVDINSNVEERPIGGLGIYFLEQYMDGMKYERQHNKNVLTLTKHT